VPAALPQLVLLLGQLFSATNPATNPATLLPLLHAGKAAEGWLQLLTSRAAWLARLSSRTA
jgi:hypothetical protein